MANEPEEKKQKDKPNKVYVPEENKALTQPSPPTPLPKGERGEVKIKFKPGRAAEGVHVGEDGTALVDVQTADYLVSIGYADLVTKGEVSNG